MNKYQVGQTYIVREGEVPRAVLSSWYGAIFTVTKVYNDMVDIEHIHTPSREHLPKRFGIGSRVCENTHPYYDSAYDTYMGILIGGVW
jgi:hypothetical protein